MAPLATRLLGALVGFAVGVGAANIRLAVPEGSGAPAAVTEAPRNPPRPTGRTASAVPRRHFRSVDEMIDALGHGDALVQKEAASALYALGRDVSPPLIAVIGRPYSPEREREAAHGDHGILCGNDERAGAAYSPRRWAVWILGWLRDPCAVEALIGVLDDEQSSIQADAAVALGRIGDTRALAPLAAALERTEDRWCAWAAAESLAHLGDPAIEALEQASHHRRPDTRLAASCALSKIPSERAGAAMVAALNDPDPSVRANALGYLLTPVRAGVAAPPVDRIVEFLADPSQSARTSAVSLLEEMRDRRAVAPLSRLLGDPSFYVRRQAKDALVAIGGPDVADIFLRGLRSPRPGTRSMSAMGLASTSDERAVKPLEAALRDRDSDVRSAARHALLSLSDGASRYREPE